MINNPNPEDRLNLRTKPSTDAPTLGKYYNGLDVTLLGAEENGWYRVGIGTLTGYMQAKFLETDPNKTWMVQAVSISFTVNNAAGTGLNLRELQSTKSKSLGFYKNGEIGYVLGVGETWCHVVIGADQVGFMLRERLSPVPVFDKESETAVVHNPDARDRLNLRTAPSTQATSLGKYYNGCTVTLLSDEKNGWVNVRIGNLEGYMEAKYLSRGTEGNRVASAMPTLTIQNASGTGLNLRERPAQSSKSFGLFLNGKSVQVLGLSQDWYHVQADGATGFMLASGFSQRLPYASSSTSNDETTAWNGPKGSHQTAEWPLFLNDYVAVVNNPNASDRLHLRASASEKADSLGKYYNGVQVIIDGPVDKEWTKVIIGNLKGYMKTSYLVISGEGKPYPASAMPIMTVNNPNSEQCIDLLAGQSLKSDFLGVYPNGTKVLLMGFDDTWAHVIVDGQVGFMLGKYLE